MKTTRQKRPDRVICTTCGELKVSSPTPDGDEICPKCWGDCMDYEPEYEIPQFKGTMAQLDDLVTQAKEIISLNKPEAINIYKNNLLVKKLLLATLSPEEQSQKIMMEQVPIKDSKPIKKIEELDIVSEVGDSTPLRLLSRYTDQIEKKINELVTRLNQIK